MTSLYFKYSSLDVNDEDKLKKTLRTHGIYIFFSPTIADLFVAYDYRGLTSVTNYFFKVCKTIKIIVDTMQEEDERLNLPAIGDEMIR